ncbi:Cysteine synthase 1 [Porphyridium purpureum]|uniref:Cysteine synthase 1 n=1 Tax=Porphyridium purpureum TaxID=35688 RepID=A0A5J4YS82_PORPP|nr:Cysteine synthase 1 [Porphyridium purpureum]|eukprot:POR0496..scf229_5
MEGRHFCGACALWPSIASLRSNSHVRREQAARVARGSQEAVLITMAEGALFPGRKVIVDNVYDSFADAVGNTPLIKLTKASAETGCTIYGKMEFLNPGGSVKDRAALYLIEDAERRGLLKPGGIIVEGTAGNTGIGLALIARCKGYRTIIVIPNTQSEEKKQMLRIAGAELVEVPAVPYRNPNNYARLAGRLAEQMGAFWANQFDNPVNRLAHIETTGPEIWQQTGGKLDAFSCAIGTGGTLSGCASYLRSQKPDITIGLTDPAGAALVHYYNHGELKGEGSSISEGIGQGRVTKAIGEDFKPDVALTISDSEGMEWALQLLEEEGLCVGISSGINVAGAVHLARQLGPGHTLVTILCDLGTRYSAKLFNPVFLSSKKLPSPTWLESTEVSPEVTEALERATAGEDEVQVAMQK